eukprot:TRINITY_DN1609_c0_g1_i1.p1 TRINITY_DN1609_c0_g1~~TRINITY_DN1609_c0_g1_i1.p1  ORF type:complete len:716 (-),score=55.71 TRINITY_DN1609_c0_g1_i1:696-2843(-)
MDKAVKVLKLNNEKYAFVFREPGSGRGILIGVDQNSGELMFKNNEGFVYDSEIACIERLKSAKYKVEIVCSGVCILGYICIGNFAGVLVATNVREVASFPGGHVVYVVSSSQWISIPLRTMSLSSKLDTAREDYKLLELVQKFPVDNVHYFCESVDITRPFPSGRNQNNPSWEFVWNEWLTLPFRQLKDLPIRPYPYLLQGLTEQEHLKDQNGVPYTVTVISRRSRLHPGTRYRARGVNRNAEPANEVEVEQIVWSTSDSPLHNLQGCDNKSDWRSVVWRRGSVPLLWGTIFNINNVTKPVIWIKGEVDLHTKAARRYFRRIQKRYHHDNPIYESSHKYPIRIVSLLRKGNIDKERSEAQLVQVYDSVIRRLSPGSSAQTQKSQSQDPKQVRLQQLLQDKIAVAVNHIDWHSVTEDHGLQESVSILWAGLADVFMLFGFNGGDLYSKPHYSEEDGTTNQRKFGQLYIQQTQSQKGLLRFNCADSLDRTNVASFYCSAQILVEQCRSLGLQIASVPAQYIPQSKSTGMLNLWGGNFRVGAKKNDDESNGQQLQDMSKKGQESNEETFNKAWALLQNQDVVRFRKAVDPSLLSAVKFMFLANGNLHAQIYTESEAMHTHQLDVFDTRDNTPKVGWMGHVKNGMTAVTRRYHNLLSDETRMKVMEMFLGMKSTEHFQGIPLIYPAQDMCELDDPETDDEQEEEEPTKEDVAQATQDLQ